jgi:hypothetical protein
MIDKFDPDMTLFQQLVHENRYNFTKLVYILFPFGEKDHDLEFESPYDWQMKEWAKMSAHLMNPETRYQPYRLCVSSGNGAAKTAFGAMTMLMLLYTQKLRGRVTANTKPQLSQIVWPEYDVWFRRARYSDKLFDKTGESIQAKDEVLGKQWRFDMFTWDDATPARVSGLHNKGHAILYTFEEAPGIPAIIFKYASGAFTDINTIKIWLVFGNSDDPDSKFEQLMSDPTWRSLRIDTRTLSHVDKNQILDWLKDVGGDENHDDFRVRVRGLPRKSNADSIISKDKISEAIDRATDFDIAKVTRFPCILTCDPAWTGGDETTVWVHQGHYSKLLARYKLDKERNEDHMITYQLLCKLEIEWRADAVLIDQGEGTTLKTLANQDQKWNWHLVNFGSAPNDTLETKDSEYANLRAQMYYQGAKWMNEGIIDAEDPKDLEAIKTQLSLTKGDRHAVTQKKKCESKKDLKERVGYSPDLADGFVLRFGYVVYDRLEQNEIDDRGRYVSHIGHNTAGTKAVDLPESTPNYDMSEHAGLYR